MTQEQAADTMKSEFAVHKLNEDGIAKANIMGWKFSELLYWLEGSDVCIEGRELSLAKTKLEEACFYAKKAMATNLVNQKK
jgi:hypothetical protein